MGKAHYYDMCQKCGLRFFRFTNIMEPPCEGIDEGHMTVNIEAFEKSVKGVIELV